MPKTALITGITGQDGSYLAEFLLHKGYIVHGLQRWSSLSKHIQKEPPSCETDVREGCAFAHYGDLTDTSNLIQLIQRIKPDELYNLAAQSHASISFQTPEYTANADALGTLRLLEAIRIAGLESKTRFFQASTSELYGNACETRQRETTPFQPRSPYGVAKLYGYWITKNYREAYGIHASNGILFNHESPARDETFVTRKITHAVAAIKAGRQSKVCLGNLDAKRDWGHAKDYVEGMWLMLQQQKPDDYVLATGEIRSVREFVDRAFSEVGIAISWLGSGPNEKGLDKSNGRVLVEVDRSLFRPNDTSLIGADVSKARDKLGWTPKRTFPELVKEMVQNDVALLSCN